MKSEVLSVKKKIGYGMGDAASHIIFDNVMLYINIFCHYWHYRDFRNYVFVA